MRPRLRQWQATQLQRPVPTTNAASPSGSDASPSGSPVSPSGSDASPSGGDASPSSSAVSPSGGDASPSGSPVSPSSGAISPASDADLRCNRRDPANGCGSELDIYCCETAIGATGGQLRQPQRQRARPVPRQLPLPTVLSRQLAWTGRAGACSAPRKFVLTPAVPPRMPSCS